MSADPSFEAAPRRERRDAAASRRQILAAARRLFAEQGVEATSMAEVARGAGVGQGTLYRRFAHKGELCMALLADDVEQFQAKIAALDREEAASPLTRLEQLIAAYLQMLTEHTPLLAAIDGAGQRRDETYRAPLYSWLHSHIGGLIGQAVARGEARPVDQGLAADALLAALAPQLIVFQLHERGYSVATIVAGLRVLFVDGLRFTGAEGVSHAQPADSPPEGGGGVSR